MEQSTLAEILGVEQEIRVQLEAEREQASRWLEKARREIDQAHEADLARLRADAEQARGGVLKAARDGAAAVIEAAETAAREQALATDDELRQLVRRHIAIIVPGVVR